jgi:hypothetical protein
MPTALVVMDESAGALDLEDILLAVRACTPFSCSYTEWQRFGVSIPQIKVETSVPLTIQIDGDPSYVPRRFKSLRTILLYSWGRSPVIACAEPRAVSRSDRPLPSTIGLSDVLPFSRPTPRTSIHELPTSGRYLNR